MDARRKKIKKGKNNKGKGISCIKKICLKLKIKKGKQ